MSALVNQTKPIQIRISPDHFTGPFPKQMLGGERVDRFLARQNLGLTRSQIQKLLDENFVSVNGRKIKAAYKVKVDDVIELVIPEPDVLEAKAENIDIEILYQDKHLAIIHKPAGLVVHASAGHAEGTLVNALLYHLKDLSGIGGALRPGIVHRLDKDTSGIMLVAKNNQAHAELVRMFQERKIQKTYWALAYGVFKNDSGLIENKIGRSKGDRKKISSKTSRGKEAKTSYKVLERFPQMALLEVKPLTGRTHQIRVHLAESGHPIVGDPVYGGRQWFAKLPQGLQEKLNQLPGQMLHAHSLEFLHPLQEKKMKYHAELPVLFKEVLKYLRQKI